MAAFGPSTPLLQQAILTLLQGRQPSPLAPVPTMPMTPPGGSFQMPLGPPPERAPIAPAPALDQALIEQLTGPRPVAPVTQPVSLLQKIALALQGFGAGTQGQGPQFLANLREQRERPQREFRAATEQFEANRRRATEFAVEKQQREQQDIQRRADIQSGREFQLYEGELRDRRQEAHDLRQQAKQLEIEDRRAKAEAARELAREQRELEREAKAITNQYFNLTKNRPLSEELGRFHSGLSDKPLSAAAAKLDAQLQNLGQVQMKKAAKVSSGTRGGGASEAASRTLAEFETLKQLAIDQIKAKGGSPKAEAEEVRKATAAVVKRMAARPDLFEIGVGRDGYMYAKPARAQGAPQQPQAAAPQNNDPLGIR